MQQVLGTLPSPVRDYLTKGGLENTARTMTSRYNLHIDQGAVLERELMLVLMGIEQPAELAQTLQSEIGLTPEQIKAILTDINAEVFQPLQDKMRAGPATPAAPAPIPAPAQPQPAPAPRPAPPNEPVHTARQVAPPPNLPGAEVQEPNIGMPPAATEANTVVYATPRPAPVAAPAPTPTPAPMPVRQPVASVPEQPIAPITQAPAAPLPQESARPILKQYGVDPYKEPIE